MKKYLLFICLAGSLLATAQNIGIGTSTPIGNLMISSGSNISNPQLYLRQTNNDFSRLRLQTGTTRYWDIAGYNGASVASDMLNVFNSAVGDILTISGSGSVGIGTTAPTSRLQVAGRTTTQFLTISSANTPYDFLIQDGSQGDVGSRKGHGALAIRYCIALQGIFPPRSGNEPVLNGADPFLGEIIMFAGTYAPVGWAFCEGQLLPINQNQALFALLGTTYGGNGITTFALPDLRGAAPVHAGTSPAGYTWVQGQRSN